MSNLNNSTAPAASKLRTAVERVLQSQASGAVRGKAPLELEPRSGSKFAEVVEKAVTLAVKNSEEAKEDMHKTAYWRKSDADIESASKAANGYGGPAPFRQRLGQLLWLSDVSHQQRLKTALHEWARDEDRFAKQTSSDDPTATGTNTEGSTDMRCLGNNCTKLLSQCVPNREEFFACENTRCEDEVLVEIEKLRREMLERGLISEVRERKPQPSEDSDAPKPKKCPYENCRSIVSGSFRKFSGACTSECERALAEGGRFD